MKESTYLHQALMWFEDQYVDVTILDMMCEMGWERHRAKGVLKSLEKKGLIRRSVSGNNCTPTLWVVA